MNKLPELYAKNNIQLSMAGSGNPWDYFISSSRLTLRALHDGYSIEEIKSLFYFSHEELQEKINLLLKANLLRKENDKYYPTFLIFNEKETRRTYKHAQQTGRIIADALITKWNEIKKEFSKLKISENYALDNLSLVLIGSKILDIGLLEVLVKDGSLLKQAPKRPSPERPDARYYFYMIDGPVEYLGKYGEDEQDLPWENWKFVTFGKNIIDDKYNEPREKIEKKCANILEVQKITSPEELASLLEVPILSKEDSITWREITRKIADYLLEKLKEKEEEIIQFYNNLQTSKYTLNSFGEFICWYIHVAYAWAIDFLVEKKIIFMPSEKFGALVIYTKSPQGLLVDK